MMVLIRSSQATIGFQVRGTNSYMLWWSEIPPFFPNMFLLWLVMQHRILTLDRLSVWYGASNMDTQCCLCEVGIESTSHLYFSCSYSREVLLVVTRWLGIDRVPLGNSARRVWMLHCGQRKSLRLSIWVAGVAAVVYWVWNECNRRRHGQVNEKQAFFQL